MIERHELISPGYLEQQRLLHCAPNGYGGKGAKWADAVVSLLEEFGATSVLDYGCGQGGLARELRSRQLAGLRIAEYDPAIKGKDSAPTFADLLTCTDVLEHCEPARLGTVLAHLKLLARKAVFLVVALDESNKLLSDGRNAHLILESPEWWRNRVTAAEFNVREADDRLVPSHYTPEKRAKRWIAVLEP